MKEGGKIIVYREFPTSGQWATTAFRAAALAAALLLANPAPADTLHTTDGRQIAGKLIALDAKQAVVEAQGRRQVVLIGEIAKISLGETVAENPMARKGQHVVWTHDGSCLAAREVSIRDGKLDLSRGSGGRWSLPLDRVARVLRPADGETPSQLEEQIRQLALATGKEDTLVVRSPIGPWVPMSGILNSLAKGEVSFTYEATDTSMKDDSVAIILLAVPKKAAAPVGGGLVTTSDGSRIPVNSVACDTATVTIESVALGSVRLSRAAVAEIQFQVQQRSFLSELAPAEVRQTPFFDDDISWQKDRSGSGRSLSLGGVTYEKGLSLPARCRMVFDLRGEFRRLSAVAGIDDEVRVGRAVLSILGDGKPLADRLLLDRARSPENLDLDLRGVTKLVITVDFAEGTFGSGARVTLGDTTLAK